MEARLVQVDQAPRGVDASTPSVARLYDYYLGGKNNFEVDRIAAERLKALVPETVDVAWANRGFHQRAARWIAERGVRQFIDIGSGLPTQGNTHEVVQAVTPNARVVYADQDPMVAAHSKALLTAEGNTAVVTADLRVPGRILDAPEVRETIDFSRPVGLLMTAVLHFVSDDSDPWGIVRRYVDVLAPGSYLALSHGTLDRIPPRSVNALYEVYSRASEQIYLRDRARVERFFEGLELVPPYPGGDPVVTYVGEWGAEDPTLADSDGSRMSYCGVARCP
ncbi:MAG: SAM-dependent methyltransferase [Micromonosporaceae bacterium]